MYGYIWPSDPEAAGTAVVSVLAMCRLPASCSSQWLTRSSTTAGTGSIKILTLINASTNSGGSCIAAKPVPRADDVLRCDALRIKLVVSGSVLLNSPLLVMDALGF